MELNDLFNTSGHILVFGHADLDGASAAALVKGAFDMREYAERHGSRGRRWARMRTRGKNLGRVVCRRINYGNPELASMRFIEKWHHRFEAIMFVDYSPTEESCRRLDSIGVPYFVIDHHKTAYVQDSNPMARYYMDYTVSGAMGVYNVLKDHLTVKHKSLAYLADDYDMWRHTNYMSKHLNVIYGNRYGFNGFIRYYAEGFYGIGLRLIENTIRPYYAGLSDCLNSLVIKEMPGYGAFIDLPTDCKYFSDITLMLEERFKWYVIARKKSSENILSFRTTSDRADLGMILKEIGRGGGGHPKAAGQKISVDEDPIDFAMQVYRRAIEIDPKAFE